LAISHPFNHHFPEERLSGGTFRFRLPRGVSEEFTFIEPLTRCQLL
jgi:hypothetical protein